MIGLPLLLFFWGLSGMTVSFCVTLLDVVILDSGPDFIIVNFFIISMFITCFSLLLRV